jgi:hypothetical protein
VIAAGADGAAVVLTPFGEYAPTAFEIHAFRSAYGHEPRRVIHYHGHFFDSKHESSMERWQEELVVYATEQMRQEWAKQ